MKKYWIYKITNLVNNKVYIGSSNNINDRKGSHFKNLAKGTHTNSHLQRSYNIHGKENFKWDIIEKGIYDFSYLELLQKEEFFIVKYDSINEDKGYNKILPTGQSFMENSFKYSRIGYENYVLKNAPFGLNKISKEEWIKRRMEDPTFSLRNEEAKREKIPIIKGKIVVVLNLKTQELKEYPSVITCAKDLNTLEVRISTCINKNIAYCQYHKIYKGLLITTKENFQPNPEIRLKPRKQRPKKEKEPIILPIIKIQNIDTLEIKEFNYSTEIASFLNTKPCRIMELKKGFKNKGKSIIVPINHFKRWKILNN